MNISVLLAHPDTHSFNHAVAHTVVAELDRNGHRVCFHDLYAERFDPILTTGEISKDVLLPPEIESHCREITAADGIVVVHPNWWGQPPAILKGWIDRVLRPGRAYRFEEGDQGEGVPVGLLKARTALVFNTANTPPEREKQVFGDPLGTLWKNAVFGLCGDTAFHRKTFTVVVTSTPEQRRVWLGEVREVTGRLFPPEDLP